MTGPADKPVALTREQQALVLDHQGFARNMTRYFARKFRGALAEDDLRQLVQLGLTESARVFNRTRGTAFTSFAWRRLTGMVIEAARGEAAARNPLRRVLGACLDLQDGEVQLEEDEAGLAARAETVAARAAAAMVVGSYAGEAAWAAGELPGMSPMAEATPEERLLAEELRARVKAAVEGLPKRQRRVVEICYREGRTLRDAEVVLGVSYATVRRDHDEALDALREAFRRDRS